VSDLPIKAHVYSGGFSPSADIYIVHVITCKPAVKPAWQSAASHSST
jgi:hypothetical protein